MEVFNLIWDFLFGTFIRIHHYLTTWYTNATDCGFVISKTSLITWSFLVIVLCGSAMAAATFAEIKFRNRLLHGILGFCLPVAYPVLLFLVIPKGVDTGKKEQKEESRKISTDALPKTNLKTFEKEEKPEDLIAGAEVMDQAFFTRISKDEHGNLLGPFIIELDDGQILEIEYIIEAFQPAVAVQIGKDEDARRIRLPYSKIKGCQTKEQWLAEAQDEIYEEEEYMEGDQ